MDDFWAEESEWHFNDLVIQRLAQENSLFANKHIAHQGAGPLHQLIYDLFIFHCQRRMLRDNFRE